MAKPQVRWRALDDPGRSSGGSASRRRVEERRRGYSSREGVLVSTKQSSLTRRRWRRSLAIINAGSAAMPGPNGVVATEGVRGQAARSARGRQSRGREARLGGARSSSTRARLCSIRSEDLRVVAKLKLEGRRQAMLHPRFARESDGTQGARVVSRLQKSERRIFPWSRPNAGSSWKRGKSRGRPGPADSRCRDSNR